MNILRQLRLGVLAAACVSASLAQSLPVANENGVSGSKLEITGVAPEGCIISAPTQQAVNNALLAASGTSAQVNIVELVDVATAVPQAASISLRFPVICNTAHVVTLTALGKGLALQTVGAPSAPGFRNHLDYQVSVGWGGQLASQLSSSGTPLRIVSPNAAAGELSVNLQVEGGGLPLEAGQYRDSLVLVLQPAN